MITITTHKIKSFSQKSYHQLIESINFYQLTCSCDSSGQLVKHAYYERTIKTPDGLVVLNILRVKCQCCGKTHAVFPEIIVPYSQIALTEHLSILKLYCSGDSFEPFMIDNEYIDESNIRYIIKQYLRYWRERLAAFALSIDDDLHFLVIACLKHFKRQFMQIKCTPNQLFT